MAFSVVSWTLFLHPGVEAKFPMSFFWSWLHSRCRFTCALKILKWNFFSVRLLHLGFGDAIWVHRFFLRVFLIQQKVDEIGFSDSVNYFRIGRSIGNIIRFTKNLMSTSKLWRPGFLVFAHFGGLGWPGFRKSPKNWETLNRINIPLEVFIQSFLLLFRVFRLFQSFLIFVGLLTVRQQ